MIRITRNISRVTVRQIWLEGARNAVAERRAARRLAKKEGR